MRKYITVKDWCGNKTTKRMVNQSEIVDYIKNNPGKTENQIMENVYGYYRNQSKCFPALHFFLYTHTFHTFSHIFSHIFQKSTLGILDI
jgi:hypothetical protein